MVRELDLLGSAKVRYTGVQDEFLDDVDPFCTFSFRPERDVVTYIVKEANKGKKKAERIGMTKKKLLKILEACYEEDFRKVEPERRRFLLMKTICFLGTKRFNDIQKLKKKDVVVREDNRVKVWMERSKTDSRREGCQFVLTKSKIGRYQ